MRITPAVLFLLFFFSGCAFAEGDPETAPGGASHTIPPAKKWYVGFGLGWGGATETDYTVVDNYYWSQGYSPATLSGQVFMSGLTLYGGYRLREHMDVEVAFPDVSQDHLASYTNSTGSSIWSKRTVYFSATTVAALLRPTSGRGFYLKLGVHSSEYGATKTVTGTAANSNTLAAGDRLPLDTPSIGWGPLIGVGMDLNIGEVGTFRLDYDYYARAGGTTTHVALFNIKYHFNF